MAEPTTGGNPDVHAVDVEALLSGNSLDAPELVIALVTGLGTDVTPVVEDFRTALQAVNYRMEYVRVSELIHQLSSGQAVRRGAETEAEQLMDEGDALREAVRHGGAACALALSQIRHQRTMVTGDARVERPRVATLIQSLKHPEEVRLLRTVYGSRLVIVGVSTTFENRERGLRARLREENPGKSQEWYSGQATRLLVRDEKDQGKALGQRVRDAFSASDAFIWITPGSSTSQSVRRIVELLFGKPFETPTRDEQGMYFAYAAQFRSAASGRQVGAACVDVDGELLATGTNDVPKPTGGQYWPGDQPDHRDYSAGVESNDRQQFLVMQDALQRLVDAGWISDEQLAAGSGDLATRAIAPGGPLAESRIGDLIEFGRIAHAEMAAISTAARRGTPLRNSTLYSTTFPCHECARLIIATGFSRVVYIDPYPKSQVLEMFGHQVIMERQQTGVDAGRLPFEPFHGIAPRLYPSVFSMGGVRRRDAVGKFEPWVPKPRLTTDPGAVGSMIGLEAAVAAEILARLESVGWAGAEDSNGSSNDVGGA